MKYLFLPLLFLFFCPAFSQWTRVVQLPPSNIFTLFHKDDALYAGGTNVIYVSQDKGQTWSSTTAVPGLSPDSSIIDNIAVYNNELYAASPSKGVFKSVDGGATWQDISAGITPSVSDFCLFRGNLYAATFGTGANSIYILDTPGRNHWLAFSKGLSALSTNVNSITGTSNTLVAGTIANGLYDYLAPGSTTWEERFLTNPISVNEAAFDIISVHDTLFLPGKTGFFYMSTDKGLSWSVFGDRLVTGASFIVNAKQALLSSRYIFDGSSNSSLFYYIKKDALLQPFVQFSILHNFFTWKLDIVGDNLWAASDRGLFFMHLSVLPGITAADDSIDLSPLPVHFISVAASCTDSLVLITWKTPPEHNSSRFGIERSTDNIHWNAIGSLPAKGTGGSETNYAFTDNQALHSAYYRIAKYDLEGKVQYSKVFRAVCAEVGVVTVWPNPVYDRLSITITSGNQSQIFLKLFDNKSALVKVQRESLSAGINHIAMNIQFLSAGIYHLVVEGNNGQLRETIRLIKQ